MNEAAALARNPRGAMIAAAGCGKTEVIATAVASYGEGKELVLTHTHAGVEAIRRRVSRVAAPTGAYQIDTIAGWSLRLARAFPETSGLPNAKPRTNADYSAVYAAATRLLALQPIREIMGASYSGVYVDEYQDCTVEQHDLVMALLNTLPCRVVGDPLQGIFSFGGNEAITWEEHVRPSFENVTGPTTPWRWVSSNPALGEWLRDVRMRLQQGQDLDVRGAPIQWIDGSNRVTKQQRQLSACYDAASNEGETVIVIHQWPNQCHDVASHLKGLYSCVEAIDLTDLYHFAARLDSSSGYSRAVVLLDFACKCMTKVRTELRTIRDALEKNRVPNVRKHRDCLDALLKVANNDSMAGVESALQSISGIPGAVTYRRELLREMIRSARALRVGEAETLEDAAWIARNRARQRGRLLSRCTVGTTLRVKGLEFDHAVVLDADAYDSRNLYVALTRGSRSLTIVSRSRVIRPTVAIRAKTE
ncbi:MAG: AAA family ATPase [Phycisphaerae bacterium]|nr:AAA family ATPase [Phycisphaerae bacterium]